MGWWVFVGEAPKEYARQARTNLGLWDGIPLGYWRGLVSRSYSSARITAIGLLSAHPLRFAPCL